MARFFRIHRFAAGVALCLGMAMAATASQGWSPADNPGRKLMVFDARDARTANPPPGPEDLLRAAGYGRLLDDRELRECARTMLDAGVSHRYRQYYEGLPVVGGGLALRLGRDGEPRLLHSSLAVWSVRVRLDFRIDAAEALRRAQNHLNYPFLRGETTTERVVLPREGAPIGCWKVSLPAIDPPADWQVYIDAASGEVLLTEDVLRRLDGRGLVFDPDPVTVLRDTTLRDRDDAADAVPEEAYSEVELPDITATEDDEYLLSGPWVDTAPTRNRAAMDSPDFIFDRGDDRFEEVMAYYHLDRQARYVAGLGFEDIVPAPIRVNANGIDADMSFYSPLTGVLTTGTGGVDDAEDADVLLHEYTHALLEAVLPDWRGGDTGMLTEGFCDYLAGDWSLQRAPDFQPFVLYNWDGHNEFWAGRVLDAPYRYPEDARRERHDAGQLWSALLTEVRLNCGDRDLWNQVLFDHLYSLTDSATVPQAATALLESDRAITDGRLRPWIVRACESRGVFPYGLYSPSIIHTPLRDTEDLDAPRLVSAVITNDAPLDTARLALVYAIDAGDPDTLRLRLADREEHHFLATLPAPRREAVVFYYLLAFDTAGVFTTHPHGAPLEWNIYQVGPDLTPPEIATVDSVYDTSFPRGETVVSARVTDNLGVQEVALVWQHADNQPGGIVPMQPAPDDSAVYVGRLSWDLQIEDVIYYRITATDASARENGASSRRFAFRIGYDMTVDDFELPNRRWLLNGWQRTDSISHQGSWALGAVGTGRDALIAELDETWDLAQFDHVRLSFRERHSILNGGGVLEVQAQEGDSVWVALNRWWGMGPAWDSVNVDLSRYCNGRSAPIRMRFRSDWRGEADYWLVDNLALRMGNIVAADDDLILAPKPEFSLGDPQPNPANRAFRFDYSLPEKGRAVVFNTLGRAVLERTLPAGRGSLAFDAEGLSSGVYLVRLDAGGRSAVKKLALLK